MFHAACRQADCTPTELVHVGDSLEADVAGANGVGAISVWLNRLGAQNDTGIVADHEGRSLTELVDLLADHTGTSNDGMHPTRFAGA